MKTKYLLLGIPAALLTLVVIVGVVFAIRFSDYQNRIDTLTIQPLRFSDYADGTYTGSYDLFLVKTKVRLTIEDKKLTDIELLQHVNGEGAPAEKILDDLLESQTLDVDVVSGATASSKAILKAAEDALLSTE